MSGTEKRKYDLKTAKRVINRNCLWEVSEVGFSVKVDKTSIINIFKKTGIDHV